MKKIYLFIAVCVIATACSVGTRKDLATGFSIAYNGFQVGNFGLVNQQNEQMLNNQVPFGEKIALVVDGIENYELKDGRVFPGLDLFVTDASGNTVLDGSDILKKEEGYALEDATVLRGTVTVGDPMVAGQTYHAKMRIWDKLKPESEIVVEGDIVVK